MWVARHTAVQILAQLVAYETFEDKKDEIKAAGGLLAGAVYATGGDPSLEFVKRYEAKYPGESYYTANQARDIIRMFVDSTRNRRASAILAEPSCAVEQKNTLARKECK